MSHKLRENIIIYGSLLAAIACLIYAGFDYYKGLSDDTKVKDEIKEAFKEMTSEGETPNTREIEAEPEELASVDKAAIIIERINAVRDRSAEDDLLNYSMIRSWGEYEIIDIQYQRQVTDNYYMYLVYLKIPNKEAVLPTEINNTLSTEEYNIITLKVYIVKNNDAYSFKHFEK